MKRIITLLFFSLFLTVSFGQKLDYDHDSKWFWTISTGGAWNTTDVKNKTNIGWGLTLGRAFNYNYGKKISFDLRFRYLGGRWRGQDYDTTSLNGYNASITTPGAVRTYYDTLGYTINNFQTKIHEFGLELVIHANSLRENSGWDPYIFGGVNLVWNQTKGDLLYEDSVLSYSDIYYYSPDGMSKKEWRNMRDNKYDLALDGSSADRYNVDFMPSLGFGLAYQLAPRFQIGLEHKTTFTLNDLFDGYIDPTERWGMFSNDIYHYTNLFLKFQIRHITDEERLELQTQNTQSTNTNVSNSGNTTPVGCLPPSINIQTPRSNSITVYENQYNVQAIIEEVAGRENVLLNVNGQLSTNFLYNPTNERFSANVLLHPGNNTIVIEAGNGCGKDERVIYINYIQCTAPIVQFVNPPSSDMTVTSAVFNVNANVVNATSVEYYVNGNRVTNFSHNNATGNFSSNTTLTRGINTLKIVAKNSCGTVTKSTIIEYTSCLNPFITLASNSNSQIVDNAQFTFNANISNVNNQNDINLRLNGMNKAFTFNPTTQQFSAPLTLRRGTNTIELFASNNCGTDRKTITIEYVPCSLPTVTFISPVNGISQNSQETVKVQLSNIQNRNQIQLRLNGVLVPTGNFNLAAQTFEATVSLQNGENTILITAVNDCGTVSQSINTLFSPCVPPAITMILPNQTMTTQASTVIKASLLNVANRNQITVTINGVVYTGGNFNALTRIYQANVSLNAGTNTIEIRATNSCGNDLKRLNIQYKPCNSPVISIISPTENTTTNASISLNVSLQNVSNVSEIQATNNGQSISNGMYSPNTKRYEATVPLSFGLNTIVIVATNSCGSVSQSITIKRTKEIRNIQICHTDQKTGVQSTIFVTNQEWITHQEHGDVLGTCRQIQDPTANVQYTICHTDKTTGQQSTIVISAKDWEKHKAHGDVKGACQDVTNEKIITICHSPNGSSTQEEMQIPESEWPVHQAHGDKLGPCVQVGTIGGASGNTITICHKIPGSNQTVQMEIPQSQWILHQRHGDQLGACNDDDDDDDNDGNHGDDYGDDDDDDDDHDDDNDDGDNDDDDGNHDDDGDDDDDDDDHDDDNDDGDDDDDDDDDHDDDNDDGGDDDKKRKKPNKGGGIVKP